MANHCDIKTSFFFLFNFQASSACHLQTGTWSHTGKHIHTLTHPASSKSSCFDKTLLSFVHEKKRLSNLPQWGGAMFLPLLTQRTENRKKNRKCIYCICGREGKNSDIITCWVILDREQNPLDNLQQRITALCA